MISITDVICPFLPPFIVRKHIKIRIGIAQIFWSVIIGITKSNSGFAVVELKKRKIALSIFIKFSSMR